MKIGSMVFFLYVVFAIINGLGQTSSAHAGIARTSVHKNIEATNNQEALIAAIRAHDISAVSRLLEQGLNPNYLIGDGPVTPLSEAIAERQPETIALLLNHKADVNFGMEKGIVPLASASWYGEQEIISELLTRGAKIEARDHEGYTALLAAASHSQGVDVIKTLLAAGADFRAVTQGYGDTALMLAAWDLNVDAVRLFIELGLDPCAQDKDGKNAMYYANFSIVKSGPRLESRKEIVKLLESKCHTNK